VAPPRNEAGAGGVAVLSATGRLAISAVSEVGKLTLTLVDGGRSLVRSCFPGERFRWVAALQQIHLMGVGAVPIVTLIALMMGGILALQSAYTLQTLGMEIFVADLVAVSMTRELGPVITAVVVAGRSGSAITAELSTMKIQEELDALKVMGLSPVSFLVVPRLLGLLIALPLLTAFADIVAILGGLLLAVTKLDIPSAIYIQRTQEALSQQDFVTGLVKAESFALIIVAVGVHCGLTVRGGPEAVGKATTRAVVLSIFLVIVADLVFTGIFFRFG
jgi:phospholipid/cholesterol/gamma-HCH transport system permease protein